MAQKTITDLRNLDVLASSLLFAADSDTETFNITLSALYDYILDRKGDIETGVIEMYMGETIPSTHTELDGKSFDVLVYPKMGALFPNGVLPDTRGMILKHAPSGRSVLSFEAEAIKSHSHTASSDITDLGWKTTTFDGDHGHGLSVIGSSTAVTTAINRDFATLNMDNDTETSMGVQVAGNHQHGVFIGVHNHQVTVNASGSAKNLVDNIAVKFIIKKA